MSEPVSFRFVEFNARWVVCGAEGVRVEVTYSDGATDLFWMSKRDIAKNMMAFGRCDELSKAHAAYGTAKPE